MSYFDKQILYLKRTTVLTVNTVIAITGWSWLDFQRSEVSNDGTYQEDSITCNPFFTISLILPTSFGYFLNFFYLYINNSSPHQCPPYPRLGPSVSCGSGKFGWLADWNRWWADPQWPLPAYMQTRRMRCCAFLLMTSRAFSSGSLRRTWGIV